MSRPDVLVGFMGAGKSTVGELLAALKGTAFVDVDRELERRTSRSIPDLLADGEEQFRELEEQVIRELLESGEYGVIAPGGGALTRPGTRALVRQQARESVPGRKSTPQAERPAQASKGRSIPQVP